MTSTPSLIPADLPTKIMDGSAKVAASFIGALAKSIWEAYGKYLPYALAILFVYLLYAVYKAATGRWGRLGSLIYHLIYFGILGTSVAIKGRGILFDPIFDFLYVLAYPISYWITGIIIKPFR